MSSYTISMFSFELYGLHLSRVSTFMHTALKAMTGVAIVWAPDPSDLGEGAKQNLGGIMMREFVAFQ